MVKKLCKFCKKFKPKGDPLVEGQFNCEDPRNVMEDMVFGGTDYKMSPFYLRMNEREDICGTAGKWFEPHPFMEDRDETA